MALSNEVQQENIKQRLKILKDFQTENSEQKNQLLIHEIYTSIQGEGSRAGKLCTFLRLSVCHLRCQYCDTETAFHHGEAFSTELLFKKLKKENAPMIQITGGEPLLQTPIYGLMRQLCDAGFEVVLETSGAISTEKVDKRVVIILDVKTPGSKEASKNKTKNFSRLTSQDEVKFVICDRLDYQWAKEMVLEHQLDSKAQVLFGVSYGQLAEHILAEWMIDDRLPYRFQIQMHKVLWGTLGGV